MANVALAVNPAPEDPHGAERRWGVIGMVEAVLFAADRYKGFRYLPSELVADGTALIEGADITRREYSA